MTLKYLKLFEYLYSAEITKKEKLFGLHKQVTYSWLTRWNMSLLSTFTVLKLRWSVQVYL